MEKKNFRDYTFEVLKEAVERKIPIETRNILSDYNAGEELEDFIIKNNLQEIVPVYKYHISYSTMIGGYFCKVFKNYFSKNLPICSEDILANYYSMMAGSISYDDIKDLDEFLCFRGLNTLMKLSVESEKSHTANNIYTLSQYQKLYSNSQENQISLYEEVLTSGEKRKKRGLCLFYDGIGFIESEEAPIGIKGIGLVFKEHKNSTMKLSVSEHNIKSLKKEEYDTGDSRIKIIYSYLHYLETIGKGVIYDKETKYIVETLNVEKKIDQIIGEKEIDVSSTLVFADLVSFIDNRKYLLLYKTSEGVEVEMKEKYLDRLIDVIKDDENLKIDKEVSVQELLYDTKKISRILCRKLGYSLLDDATIKKRNFFMSYIFNFYIKKHLPNYNKLNMIDIKGDEYYLLNLNERSLKINAYNITKYIY